jgi:hypothetical protein
MNSNKKRIVNPQNDRIPSQDKTESDNDILS